MLCYELPYVGDSADLFARIAHLTYPVWLDSGAHGASAGRYDIIAADPLRRLIYEKGQSYIEQDGERKPHSGDFFELLASEQASLGQTCHSEPVFCGGLIGYLSYELGMELPFNQVAQRDQVNQHDGDDFAQAQFGLYSWAIVQDHQQQKTWCLGPDLSRQGEDLGERQRAQMHKVMALCQTDQPAASKHFRCGPFAANISPEQYQRDIDTIHNYIHAGDCYQVNYTQQFSARFEGSSLGAYLALRQTLPSPFSAYIPLTEGAILSHSPERFIRVQGRQVETQPIKGTIARGHDQHSDQAQAQRLLSSRKDRAENLMIVDLLRNDLSRNCQLGSVRTPTLFALHSYPNVHHLVSTVTGTLSPDASAIAVLKDSFPGGSITGAPKKRAMEIIAELEPHQRSIYCGSVVYLSANGNMDSSIAIRTLLDDGRGQIHVWGGGGITADSSANEEYQESLNKIDKLMQGLQTHSTDKKEPAA